MAQVRNAAPARTGTPPAPKPATIRRIGITTGGGDAPGLNAVIRGVVMSARHRGWECVGIRNGYDGLLDPTQRARGLVKLDVDQVRPITKLGGTILGTTNAGNPFAYPCRQRNGEWVERDRGEELLGRIRRAGIDALVAIGGDGSLGIAKRLADMGLPVVGVPKTIDNDLEHTAVTFGFDSAVSFATECIDRLHATALSHRRVMVVEVMGRYVGWIALHSGLSSDAHVILIPEIDYDIEKVAAAIRARYASGHPYAIVVVAEGAKPKGGAHLVRERRVGRAERLGGIGEQLAADLATLTGEETRATVLGHLLRGGHPTTFDRLIALRFGGAAVRALAAGESGVMVSLGAPGVRLVPLARAIRRLKRVPPLGDTISTARDLGICLGE
ncbi:MAG: ATP-dependent 6-phosphofructokinase [Burkholderiaceae bacterium]